MKSIRLVRLRHSLFALHLAASSPANRVAGCGGHRARDHSQFVERSEFVFNRSDRLMAFCYATACLGYRRLRFLACAIREGFSGNHIASHVTGPRTTKIWRN